jgi:hypothetical protein
MSRPLVAGLLLSLLLSGCAAPGKPWFPPASALPDGLTPIDLGAAPGNLTLRFLGMASNPGRTTAVAVATELNLTGAEAYLLRGASPYETYVVLALTFHAPAMIASLLAAPGGCTVGSPVLRDGLFDARHVSRSGDTFLFVMGGGRLPRAAVVDDLARIVQERSNAAVLC